MTVVVPTAPAGAPNCAKWALIAACEGRLIDWVGLYSRFERKVDEAGTAPTSKPRW